MLRNEKGFTLLEIIAVLVILGILAAVAVPKYISLLDEARNSSALAALAEVKGRASGYYGLLTLRNGTAPAAASVLASVGTPIADLGVDYYVTTSAAGSNISISVGSVKGVALSSPVVGTWIFPTNP